MRKGTILIWLLPLGTLRGMDADVERAETRVYWKPIRLTIHFGVEDWFPLSLSDLFSL